MELNGRKREKLMDWMHRMKLKSMLFLKFKIDTYFCDEWLDTYTYNYIPVT